MTPSTVSGRLPSPAAPISLTSGRGALSDLTPDLLQAVASNLPQSDLLNLSHASRACLSAARLATRSVTVKGARLADVLRLYPGLTQIKLTDARDEHLAVLAGRAGIKRLDLAGCGHLTDQGIAHLVGLSDLVALDLRRCFGLGDRAVEGVASQCPALESLEFGLNPITDSALHSLTRCTALKHLKFVGCDQISTAGVSRFLATALQLEELALDYCQHISRESLVELQQHHPKVRLPTASPAPLQRSDDLGRMLQQQLVQLGLA